MAIAIQEQGGIMQLQSLSRSNGWDLTRAYEEFLSLGIRQGAFHSFQLVTSEEEADIIFNGDGW